MKFTFLFIVFNMLIVAFFGLIFAVPAILFSRETASVFFSSLWPLAGGLLVSALAVDIFFVFNFRLYRLLENQDWPVLAAYLKTRVLEKGRFGGRHVRLLANTWFVLEEYGALRRLEETLAGKKPALLEDNALLFGAARLSSGDYAGAELFFAEREAKARGTARDWLRFYRGLSFMMRKDSPGQAEELFSALARTAKEPFITGLSAWFLARLSAEEAAEAGRGRVQKMLRGSRAWKFRVSRRSGEIHVSLLAQYLAEAEPWIFAGQAAAVPAVR